MSVGAINNAGYLIPIDLDIQESTEPAAMSDIRRSKETLRSRFHEHLLRALRRCAPKAEAIVVVVVGGGHEQLATHKPGRLPVAQTLCNAWQSQTDASHSIERGGIARSMHVFWPVAP